MNLYKNNTLYFCILTLFLISGVKLNAQSSPGGTGLTTELWLRADKVQATIPSEGTSIKNWLDGSTNGRNFVADPDYPNITPRFTQYGLNYQPSIEFYFDEDISSANNRRRKLVSASNFPTMSTKAYYTFWVSELDAENSENYATVFAFNRGRGDNNGWSNDGVIWHETRTTNYVHQGTGKSYGISVAIRPNTTSADQVQYHDGVKGTEKMSGRLMYNETGREAIIGSSNTAYGDDFFGTIQEIIVLSANAGSTISDENLAKVNSYLAIKYGLTVAGTFNYINSSGVSVWDRSTTKNTGFQNDIFGIGYDVASGLNQKQSSSQSYKGITVFVGDDIEDLNINNNSTLLSDKDYLMFGANNGEEFSEYEHPVGFSGYQNGLVLPEETNFRMNRVLKAQATKSFTVNMRGHGRYVLVSPTDPTFAPENTRIYHVEDDGIARNVVINDGDYIGFATFETAPGGVINGLKMWLRADDTKSVTRIQGTTHNVDVWKDQSSNNNNYSFRDVSGVDEKTRPTYLTCDMRTNFNPSVSFDISDYLAIKNGPMTQDAPVDFTSFVLYYATAYASDDRLYTHGFGSSDPRSSSTRRPALGFAPGDGVGRVRNSGGAPGESSVDGTLPGFVQNSAALQMINTHKQASGGQGYAIHDFGGWQEKVLASGGFCNGFKMASGGTLGGSSITNGSFQGLISEVFYYERALTSAEQDKIRTYLGIKYAITLDADGNNPLIGYKYILSDGSTVVWDGNSAPTNSFHRNIAGLVRDDDSHLFINKSKSSGKNPTITMMVKGHTECGQGDASELVNNLSGLYWGHDGGTQETKFEPNDPEICGEMDYKTNRVWLVQKTNLDKITATIRFGTSTIFAYNSPGYQVYLLAADSKEKLMANKWDMAVPGTFIDGEQQVDFTFLNKYTYFSIGVKTLPGTCEACDFNGTQNMDFSSWTRGALSKTFNLQNDFSAKIETSIASPGEWVRNYPRASSYRSLREYRRRNAKAIMKTTISFAQTSTGDNKAAAANFDIYEIDYRSGKYDNVKVYGLCDGATILPRLNYTLGEKKSSYTIEGNVAKAKRRPTSSYTATKGRMHVNFDFAVQQVVIEHTTTGSASGLKRIGISPIEFSCPQPIPPVNEAGLSFVKQGASQIYLCQKVKYTFKIFNANCDDKFVNFTDILEDGMAWVPGSIELLSDDVKDLAVINDYGGTNTLSIKNLKVLGGSYTLIFTVDAIFTADAVAKTYENQASIDYKMIVDGIEKDGSLVSCDGLTAGTECQKTKTVALDTPNRPSPVTVAGTATSCFREGSKIKVSIELNNPNSYSIAQSFLDIGFNEDFAYIASSYASTISGTPSIDISESGLISVGNFSIPAGKSTVSFEVKAPNTLTQDVDSAGNLIFDSTGKPVWMPLNLDFEFTNDTTDICEEAILSGANGEFELEYCSSLECIISNKNVTSKVKR